MIKIKTLHIYPIKALGGIEVEKSEVTSRGLKYDRRWVLVNEKNRFVSQREFPQMALLKPDLKDEVMQITDLSGKMPSLTFELKEPESPEEMVTVWDDSMTAKAVSHQSNQWFTEALGMPLRLMYMHEASVRPADPRFAVSKHDHVSFADGYPILIISEASMDLLNEKTGLDQSFERFRANIIISGAEPHEEDQLRHIKINEQELYGVKPCARCQVPTIDPKTAEMGKEPMKTLATYRRIDHKILFGENFIPVNESIISVGDSVEIIEKKEALI